jgi:hypothetical protein
MNLMTLHSPKELHKLILVFWVLLFIQNINQLLIFLHVVGGHLEKKVNITSAARQASCVFSKVLALHKVPCQFFAHLNSPPDAGVTRTRSLPDVESQRGACNQGFGIHTRLRLRQTRYSGNVPCLGVLPTAYSSSKLPRHVILFDGRVLSLLITL